MGVVVDTPGAVTCALRGRPKSEGIAVHTWSCDGSLAGPLLLEFIVGWSCVGAQVERWFDRFLFRTFRAWRQSDSAQAFLDDPELFIGS